MEVGSRWSAWTGDWRGRAVIGGIAAIAAALLLLTDAWRNPTGTTDFDQVWYAARAVRQGLDPYDVIGPAGPFFRWDWRFYYPMTAVVLVMPLSFLPLLVARLVFVGASAGLLAYGLANRPWRLVLLLSAPVVMGVHAAQWSLLFAGSVLLPALAVVSAVKPNLGAAVLLGQARRAAWLYAIAGSAALGVVSFAAAGWWIPSWLAAVRTAPHFRPYVMHLGGVLLLLALLRWRRPEARLLAAYALVPHTTVLYEAAPVLLVAETRRECLSLAVASGIAFLVQHSVRAPDTPTYIWRLGEVTLWLVFMPALVIVLRRKNRWQSEPRAGDREALAGVDYAATADLPRSQAGA
jgi:hypothetical protein